MDKLIDYSIVSWPCLSKILVLIMLTILILGLPFAIWWWFKKFINKERYVFQQGVNHLYCLDTMTGNITVARGLVFQKIAVIDSMFENKDKGKSEEDDG